jgi:hypothetical protein
MKINSVIRCKAPAQPSVYIKVHILTLYPFHFLKLCPLSNVPLSEGQDGTDWEHLESRKKFLTPLKLISLSLSLSLSSF